MEGHWIELSDRILFDPKMGTLPDWLWRRSIELFLLAGRNRKEGRLPSIDEMCWILRVEEKALRDALSRLKTLGVVREDAPDEWTVTSFLVAYDEDES